MRCISYACSINNERERERERERDFQEKHIYKNDIKVYYIHIVLSERIVINFQHNSYKML